MARWYTTHSGMTLIQPKNGHFSLQEVSYYVGENVHIAILDSTRVAIVCNQYSNEEQNQSISVGEAKDIMEAIVENYDRLDQLNGPVLICSPQEYGIEE